MISNSRVANHANIGVVNYFGLACMYRILYVFFMHHDFPDEQTQQLRRQFLNVGVTLVLGDDDSDFIIFHVRHHALEIRAIEVGIGISVIYIELRVWEQTKDGGVLRPRTVRPEIEI